mgnify:CR=1 FL=1
MPSFPESFNIPKSVEEWMSLDMNDPNIPIRAKAFRRYVAIWLDIASEIDDKDQIRKIMKYVNRKIELLPSSREDIVSFMSPFKDYGL